MYPILFSIGKINFYSYGLMAGIAFLASSLVIVAFAKKEKLFFEALFDRLIICFIAGIVVARLSYFIVYFNQFQHLYDFFTVWEVGMISYGGILGGLIAYILFFRKNLWRWLDFLAIGFTLGLFFWRMGCFLSGDHPQVNYTGLIAINGEFPAILIESLSGFLGFGIFTQIYKKIGKYCGITFFAVLAYYGFMRILVDHFRIDPLLWGLKTGQIVGIIFALVGIIGIIVLSIKRRKNAKPIEG